MWRGSKCSPSINYCSCKQEGFKLYRNVDYWDDGGDDDDVDDDDDDVTDEDDNDATWHLSWNKRCRCVKHFEGNEKKF